MINYDSDEPPSTLEEAISRLKQSIVWEFLESGMYKEMPCSTFQNWNIAGQKRYTKAADNLKRFLDSSLNEKPKKTINESSHESINKDVKTLRDYLRG